MISTCPDAQAWQALLQGALPAEQQSEMNGHLEGCAACQQTLEGIVASQESWSGTAKELHDAPLDPTGKLGQVMAQLKARTAHGETQAEGDNGPDMDLSFLQPSTIPGHLGRIRHYEILEIIGNGGFGTVFKAKDTALDRIVAVKVLAPQLASNATARKRFAREAKAAAAVSHDHVVGIFAVEETETGIPYLAMQLIHGKTLQQRIDKCGPLELKEILRIGMQIASGLAAAHDQGHIHRDVKPANILLENGVERVKITDFGLARMIDDASLTQSGVIAGTPMFMAPEQAAGEAVDHRADLFSLGSVMYTMCTGRPPFRASGTLAVLKRVAEDTPTPIRTINPDVPEWLCDIVAKLQAKKPDERLQTARAVAALLGQHLAHLQRPDQAPRPAPVSRPSEPPSSPPSWSVGDRVLAPWEPEWLYPGTVREMTDDSAHVIFDDDDKSWVAKEELRPLSIDLDARVEARWTQGSVYFPGVLKERQGELFHVAYDDGDKEWTQLKYLRVPSGKPAPKRFWMNAAKVCFFLALILGYTEWSGYTNLIGFVRGYGDFVVTLEIEEPPVNVKIYEIKVGSENEKVEYLISGRWNKLGPAHAFTTDAPIQMVRLAEGNYMLVVSKEAQFVRGRSINAKRGGAQIVRIGKAGKVDGNDVAKLRGKWFVSSQEREGKVVDAERRTPWFEFTGDRIRAGRAEGGAFTEQLFAIDPTESPKQIHLFGVGSNAHEGSGIYKLDNGTLTLCITRPEDPPPTEFRARIGTGDVLTISAKKTSEAPPSKATSDAPDVPRKAP